MKPNAIRTLVLTTILMTLVWTPAMLSTVRAQAGPGGFPDLVSGLKATPGCVGVETARTASGKQVIFAWFENKTAALNWYYSEMHQATMHQFMPNAPARTPMADVPDDGAPIMAIASLTMAPTGGESKLPFSQIAIELYRPLPGGIALGGRFAPSGVKVPGLREVPGAGSAGPNQQ
jgi:hypothetical protein